MTKDRVLVDLSASAAEIHARFLAIAQDLSPELERAIAQTGPVELTANQALPFAEHLCRAVAGQQLSVKAARTIWSRVLENKPDNQSLMAYFAEASPDSLRGCGLSSAKAKTVGAIAQAALSGQLDAAELSLMSPPERTDRLTALWGVGPWTADMMNIFYFGELDIWPDGDLAARKTLEKLTSKRRKTVRTAARFAPYRSYLALYMWRYLDAIPVATSGAAGLAC